MKFFKPGDFKYLNLSNATNRLESLQELASNIANTLLEREGKVVLTRKNVMDIWLTQEAIESSLQESATHKALLINIEPIEKCEHPKEKVRKIPFGPEIERPRPNLTWSEKIYQAFEYKCECGVKVAPTGFEEVKHE